MKKFVRMTFAVLFAAGISGIIFNNTLLASCGVCGSGDSHRHGGGGHEVKKEKKAEVAKDPICGMEIKNTDNAPTAEFKGKTYYFCSEDCQKVFNERIGRT